MTVMDDFREYLLPATFQTSDSTGALGMTMGTKQSLSVILDEGTATNLSASPSVQSDSILIYAAADSPVNTHACMNGVIQVMDGVSNRRFRITDWNVARDPESNVVDHIELSGEELGG